MNAEFAISSLQRYSPPEQSKHTHCFHLVDPKTADENPTCPICMDALHVVSGPNEYIRCISCTPGKEEIEKVSKPGDRSDAIAVTPCGHAFHRGCLGRWAAERA